MKNVTTLLFVFLSGIIVSLKAQHTLIDVPVSANSGEALRIDNSSRVHSPYLTLYRNGAFRGFLQAAVDKFEIGTSNSIPLTLTVNGTEHFRLNSLGIVSIGTLGVAAKLNVASSLGSVAAIEGKISNTTGSGIVGAITAINESMDANGVGLYASHAGSGAAVYAFSTSGIGLRGSGNVGVYARNPNNAEATRTSLVVNNGFIRVSKDVTGGVQTAFQFDVSGLNFAPMPQTASHEATDLIIASPVVDQLATSIPPWAVVFDTGAWTIKSLNGSNFPPNTKFNILVIKQ